MGSTYAVVMALCILRGEKVSDTDAAFLTVAQTNISGSAYPCHKECLIKVAVADYPLPFRERVSCCTPLVVTSSFGSERERRERDPRRSARGVEDECDLVDVAPAPVLTGLE